MPGGDKTGPFGKGPMSGRRLGYCTGNDQPGFTTFRGSSGFGHGRGLGRHLRWRSGSRQRFRNWNEFHSETIPPGVSQETLLENEAKILKEQLAFVEKELAALKKKTE